MASEIVLQRWASDNGISLYAARKIRKIANAIARLGEKECNEGSEAVPELPAKHIEFGRLIKQNGFEGFTMPGLYPLLQKNGKNVHLPD